MNVLFHIATAATIAVVISEPNKLADKKVVVGLFTFIIAVIAHAALDYIPHCYPINSKIDAILGLGLSILLIAVVKKEYKFIFFMSLLGSVFPDLIDLSPAIINSLVSVDLPVFDNIFPWHNHQYSGSIYTSECGVSAINHMLVILVITMIFWIKRNRLRLLLKY